MLGFLGGSNGKESPAWQETWVRSLDWEDPLEKGIATHSSILSWRIPWGCKESNMTLHLPTGRGQNYMCLILGIYCILI